MKKFLPSLVVAAAALAGANAFAQDAECSRNGNCPVPQAAPYGYGYGGIGANGLPVDGNQTLPAVIGLAQQSVQQSGNSRYWPYSSAPYAGLPYAWGVPQYQAPYARSERDRDGDGVRNSRDRYPDDPRYR